MEKRPNLAAMASWITLIIHTRTVFKATQRAEQTGISTRNACCRRCARAAATHTSKEARHDYSGRRSLVQRFSVAVSPYSTPVFDEVDNVLMLPTRHHRAAIRTKQTTLPIIIWRATDDEDYGRASKFQSSTDLPGVSVVVRPTTTRVSSKNPAFIIKQARLAGAIVIETVRATTRRA